MTYDLRPENRENLTQAIKRLALAEHHVAQHVEGTSVHGVDLALGEVQAAMPILLSTIAALGQTKGKIDQATAALMVQNLQAAAQEEAR